MNGFGNRYIDWKTGRMGLLQRYIEVIEGEGETNRVEIIQ